MKAIAFVSASDPEAQACCASLIARYGQAPIERADVVVALGGDGFMLKTLKRFMDSDLAVYGVNFGAVGFLMNARPAGDLIELLGRARVEAIHPLRVEVTFADGRTEEALALNDVSAFRMTHQVAKIRVRVDGVIRMEELVGDGLIVATPVGSTAYNLSANGPIVPIGSNLLALTPINSFRPRRWRGALLPDKVDLRYEVREADKRPIAVTADHHEFRSPVAASVRLDRNRTTRLLFDPGHALEERIMREQFVH